MSTATEITVRPDVQPAGGLRDGGNDALVRSLPDKIRWSGLKIVSNERRIAWGLCAGVVLCASAHVSAATIYKQVDAAGHVTYTDRPGTTPLPAAAAAPLFAAPLVLDVVAALASHSAMSSRHAVMIDANEAARRLGQAERERALGAERQPGEQAGSGDAGTSNDRYRRRQEELLRAVRQAQLRSIEAGRLLSARL